MDFEFKDYPNFSDKGPTNCSSYDPELFFPDPESINFYYMLKVAKNVCTSCPYQLECLQFAVENNEPGVWGGTAEGERRRMKRSGRVTLPTPTVKKNWSGKPKS